MPQPDKADEATQILALVKAQGAVRGRLTVQAVSVASRSAKSFSGWYDTAEITAWTATLARQVESIQRVAAQSTDAYLARVLSILTGGRVRAIGRVDVTGLRPGVTHAGAYGRAADVYRWQQSRIDTAARALLGDADGIAPPLLGDPIEAAINRVIAVADMDVQLAARAQSQKVIDTAADKGLVTGYRRVIHPELSRGGTCGLCVAASDRMYHAKELLPIHGRCHCTTLPVTEASDPGSILNEGDLARLYKDAGSTAGADLKGTRYQIDDHGELGPVLNPHGAKVRGPRQVERDTNAPRPAKTPEQKLAQVQQIRDSLVPAEAKLKELATQDSQEWDTFLRQIEARVSDLDHQLAS